MADIWYLDYSAAKLSGTTIKNAGYRGAIRYIAAGRESKQTNLTEYRSHLAAGLDVWLVCQAGTSDADQGFARGAELARAAKAEADGLGYPSNRVIFFTNDRVELPSPAAWRAFLDGAASVLGRSRVGAYGFANAMDAAKGHAVAFWQAGRRSELRAHVNFWQDNNTQVTVGGILCDRNLLLKPIQVENEVELKDTFNRTYWNEQYGTYGFVIEGIRQLAESGRSTANAAKASADRAQIAASSANTGVGQLTSKVDALSAKVDKIQLGGVDHDLLADKLAERLAKRLAD